MPQKSDPALCKTIYIPYKHAHMRHDLIAYYILSCAHIRRHDRHTAAQPHLMMPRGAFNFFQPTNVELLRKFCYENALKCFCLRRRELPRARTHTHTHTDTLALNTCVCVALICRCRHHPRPHLWHMLHCGLQSFWVLQNLYASSIKWRKFPINVYFFSAKIHCICLLTYVYM